MATQTQTMPTMPPSGVPAPKYHQRVSSCRPPVLEHVVTDEELGFKQVAHCNPVNLAKVAKLLEDPLSAKLYDRHIAALRKIAKHNPNGFVMRDLVAVFRILNVCAERIADVPLYIPPMLDILRLCSLPYLKEKTSDEICYEQIAVESVSLLGYLLRVPNRDMWLQVCETIRHFYCEAVPGPNLAAKYQPNTREYNRRIVEKSDVAETLVKALALLEDDAECQLHVISLLQKLSKCSPPNCNHMLQACGAAVVCSHLMDSDPTGGQLLFRSVEILWNLLECGDRDEASRQLSNIVCICQLRDAFVQQMTCGYSHYDRQLRNDLLVIASLIAGLCYTAPFVETGFAKQLVMFATFQEVRSHNALVKHLKLLPNHEDFELKKLLINMLVLLGRERAAIPILSEGCVILALFCYVKGCQQPDTTCHSAVDWTPSQYEEIQLHAMTALCTLAPCMIDDYMSCQGGTRLLLMLEWCTGPDRYAGFGNGFHATGGCGSKRAQLRHCLRLIRRMVATGDTCVLLDFTDQGAIGQLTCVLQMFIADRAKMSKVMEDAIDVEIQCDLLFTLSMLCDNDVHRKELFGACGVDVVVEYLKMDLRLLTLGLGHHRLLVTAIDCVWCTIVSCYINEDYFMEKEGVFMLLDLLESCPRSMHSQLFGCLLDLCDNQKTLPHINMWRGRKDQSAPHMFCDMWRTEERLLCVPRTTSGAICDTSRPLMGSYQESQGTVSQAATCPSPAIVDVSENLRAKIYSVFCKIGFVDLPGLMSEDHVTLALIEHYLDLKAGEVWSELICELKLEDVDPVSFDAEALSAVVSTVKYRAEHVTQAQNELLEAQKQQDLIDEQEHYAQIRENYRQKETAWRKFGEYVSRTSNYMMLKAAKERQELSIDASRVQTNYRESATFHDINLPKLNITVFAGRNVGVQSVSVVPCMSGDEVCEEKE